MLELFVELCAKRSTAELNGRSEEEEQPRACKGSRALRPQGEAPFQRLVKRLLLPAREFAIVGGSVDAAAAQVLQDFAGLGRLPRVR